MRAVIWSKYNCPYCDQAKALLQQKKIEFEEKKIGDGYTKEDLFLELDCALETLGVCKNLNEVIIKDILE